jgi:hypothetical protein
MEKKTKLTIRVEQQWVENAKRYAARHNTTLTQLVSDYLRHLSFQDSLPTDTPILQRLTGILPVDVSIEDYQAYLGEKFDG